MTRLGTVSFTTKLRLEASGRAWRVGWTVTYPPAVAFTDVTLRTTPLGRPSGTPATPERSTSMVPPLPSGVLRPPNPVRVWTTRPGAMAVNRPLAAPPQYPRRSTTTWVWALA